MEYIKWIVQAFSLLLSFPLIIFYKLFSSSEKSIHIWQFNIQLLSLLPGLPGNYIRQQYFTYVLTTFKKNSIVEFGTILNQPSIEIGESVYIGANCCIGLCSIGDNTMLGSNVDILSGKRQHFFDDIDKPIRDQGGVLEKIQIGDDCWLGNNSVIMANIGRKSIVAAGSVVIEEVPPYSIVGGNPARLLKCRQG